MLSKVFSFQFPSNGKVYPKRRNSSPGRNRGGGVSIPFKRESISKAENSGCKRGGYEFQFPSNGKVYPKTVRVGTLVDGA